MFTTSGPTSPMAKGDPIALMQADKAHVGVLNGTYTANLDQRTAVYFTSLGLSIAGTGKANQLYGQTTVYMCSPKLYTLLYLKARGVIANGNQVSFNRVNVNHIPVLTSLWFWEAIGYPNFLRVPSGQ